MSSYNYPRGETHHRARHSNDTVERARVMRDKGWSYQRIGNALGISRWTVRDWVVYRGRASG